jgi:pSer/pThr/pTyr-binding forkhead associated (FHA) protein
MGHVFIFETFDRDTLKTHILCFEQSSVSIGRSPSSDIHVHEMNVSRNHAIIRGEEESARAFLVDCGSTNGVHTVNGDSFMYRGPRALFPGDVCYFGGFRLRLKWVDWVTVPRWHWVLHIRDNRGDVPVFTEQILRMDYVRVSSDEENSSFVLDGLKDEVDVVLTMDDAPDGKGVRVFGKGVRDVSGLKEGEILDLQGGDFELWLARDVEPVSRVSLRSETYERLRIKVREQRDAHFPIHTSLRVSSKHSETGEVVVHFRQQSIVLGRKTSHRLSMVHLEFDGGNVSRVHCRMDVQEDGTVMIRDHGSTNGTYVNGRLIRAHEAKLGDKIYLGDWFIEFLGTNIF